MSTYAEQVRILTEFYTANDPTKDEQSIVAIVDKRKAQKAELSPTQWTMICAQLKKKYGQEVVPASNKHNGAELPSTTPGTAHKVPLSEGAAPVQSPPSEPLSTSPEAELPPQQIQATRVEDRPKRSMAGGSHGSQSKSSAHGPARINSVPTNSSNAADPAAQVSNTSTVLPPRDTSSTAETPAARPDPTLQEQIQALTAFYAEHDQSKDQRDIVAILDKRRGTSTALSTDQWAALAMQLEKKYGHPLALGDGLDSWTSAEIDAEATGIVVAGDGRIQNLAQLAPEALAAMVVEKEMQIAQLRDKAKQKVRELMRQKEAAMKTQGGRSSATVAALETQIREVTRRAEVRQKRIDQLQTANQKQKSELESLRQESSEAKQHKAQQVNELKRRVQDLSDEAEASAAEQASHAAARQRELESTRQEHAALQVEVMELAAALTATERSQLAWQSEARAAQEAMEYAKRAAAAAKSKAGDSASSTAKIFPDRVTQHQQSEGEGGLDDVQLAVVEARVLRGRCDVLEQRARSLQEALSEAQQGMSEAEAMVASQAASMAELENRHQELVKAWVVAQPSAAQAEEDAEQRHQEIQQLQQRLQRKDEEVSRLQAQTAVTSGAVMSSVVSGLANDADQRFTQSRVLTLEDELEEEKKMVALAREESAYLKAELRSLEQREVGVKAADGEYLKNIVLGYIEKTGDRVQLLGVLAELLQFSKAEVKRVQARSSSWLPF